MMKRPTAMMKSGTMERPCPATTMAALAMLAMTIVSAQTLVTPPPNSYTPAQDVELGRQAASQAEQQLPIMHDDAVTSYVEDVGRRLVAAIPPELRHAEFHYTFQVVNVREINAFALPGGPMFVNRGMIEAASTEGEVAGVMAHELAHIKNHDTLTMTIAAAIGGAISMLAQYMQFGAMFGGHRDDRGGLGMIGTLLAIIVAPLAAMLVQMAISRSREYVADNMGAQIAGRPMWLASALAKIQNYAHRIPNEEAEMAPATAHMFIINPLTGQGMDNLFSTHPNTENRIAALEALAREMGQTGGPRADGGIGRDSSVGNDTDPGPWSQQRSRDASGPWG